MRKGSVNVMKLRFPLNIEDLDQAMKERCKLLNRDKHDDDAPHIEVDNKREDPVICSDDNEFGYLY